MKKRKVIFYDSSLESISSQKFYQIDFEIIESNGYDLLLTDNILDLFKFWQYDILFVYFYTRGVLPAFIAKLFGKQIFFTGGIDSLDQSTETKKRFYIQKIFFYICYNLATKCIIVSDNDWYNIMQVYKGKLLKKLVKSYHAIDVEKFLASVDERNNIFLSVCWQGSILNISRKGIDKSLLLFKLLINKPEFADFKYIIAGRKGTGTQYIEELINKYNLSDRVIITGEISEEEKIRLMQTSKYYFQLSYYEGFGLAALEALAAGNIIIHSNAGGLKYVVGSDGVIINRDRIEAEIDDTFNKLKGYDSNKLKEAQNRVLMNYSISNRQKDFAEIFSNTRF